MLAETRQKPQAETQNAAKTAIKILKGSAASLPSAAALVEACNKLLPIVAKLLILCSTDSIMRSHLDELAFLASFLRRTEDGINFENPRN